MSSGVIRCLSVLRNGYTKHWLWLYNGVDAQACSERRDKDSRIGGKFTRNYSRIQCNSHWLNGGAGLPAFHVITRCGFV